MEVFDKEGVAVKKNRSEGFVMAEVLVTVLFVTVFTSLLFSFRLGQGAIVQH